ncbi:MAG TPA: DeoR/GlpR family DNA-binding transcription regulator [Opitutus sp.]|nr:DeoR/GlpR family DNA-binding transcription regulator [Opitutus sp.]
MRVPRHIVDQRREQLRAVVRTDGFLPIAEICRRLGVSEATARRDLAAIAAHGHVTRTWGGALADYNAAFASHGERASRARSAKGRIAAAAAARVPRTGVVFLDAGTTVQAVARQLLGRADFAGLRVVTNSLAVASMLGGAGGLELHVLGGTFLHRQAVLLGDEALRALADWHFTAAFLGGEGFDAAGVTNSHAELAAFQRAVVRRSAMAFFCLDGTKLGRTTPHHVVPWGKSVSLVTNLSKAALAVGRVTLPARQLVAA